MPLLVLEVLLQIICAVHAVRTGRGNWLFVILAFPVIGPAVYFFSEILPDIRYGRLGKRTTENILNTFRPTRGLKKSAKALEISDNVENRLKLADECFASGLYDDAIQYYESTLNGIYENNPYIMLKLARTYFYQDNFSRARQILDDLITKNPDFKSPEGHLLYARCLEGLGEFDKALEEYAVLANYYSGYEAKCRYALLLKKQGEVEKARQLFQEIIDRTEQLPRHLRKPHRDWIDIARSHL
jgi:hypothetical protein